MVNCPKFDFPTKQRSLFWEPSEVQAKFSDLTFQ